MRNHQLIIVYNNITAGTRSFKPGTKGAELVPEICVASDNIFVKTKSNTLRRFYDIKETDKSELQELKDLEITDRIIDYLKEAYQPDAIIVYGSFADGSANENSDFDALVIANSGRTHDSSVIDNIVLDVFIYSPDTFYSDYAPDDFVQVWDGKIILDRTGVAGHLQKRVLEFIESVPLKTAEEIQREIS